MRGRRDVLKAFLPLLLCLRPSVVLCGGSVSRLLITAVCVCAHVCMFLVFHFVCVILKLIFSILRSFVFFFLSFVFYFIVPFKHPQSRTKSEIICTRRGKIQAMGQDNGMSETFTRHLHPTEKHCPSFLLFPFIKRSGICYCLAFFLLLFFFYRMLNEYYGL